MNKNINTPYISIVMSVYNGEKYLYNAIKSIFEQTYKNFEFIIVDDGSNDNTLKILMDFSIQDNRLNIHRNYVNKERCISRNIAINCANSDIIAVMDADDVALPDRLEKQVAFMSANTDVLVCGGAEILHESNLAVRRPVSDEAIRIQLLWGSSFCHPTVMFRREPVLNAGGYDPAMPPTEDYDLWIRLAALRGWRFANLDTAVLRYREHPHADRRAYRAIQFERAAACVKTYLLNLGMAEGDLDMEAHLALCFQNEARPVSLSRARAWAERLMRFNLEAKLFDPELFNDSCLRQLNSAYVKARWLPVGLKRLIPAPVKHWVKKNVFALKQGKV